MHLKNFEPPLCCIRRRQFSVELHRMSNPPEKYFAAVYFSVIILWQSTQLSTYELTLKITKSCYWQNKKSVCCCFISFPQYFSFSPALIWQINRPHIIWKRNTFRRLWFDIQFMHARFLKCIWIFISMKVSFIKMYGLSSFINILLVLQRVFCLVRLCVYIVPERNRGTASH